MRATVAAVAGHMVQCCVWYAVDLAAEGRSGGDEVIKVKADASAEPAALLAALATGARLLSAAVDAAGPDVRGFHPFGHADRVGFAAMGCDELLVHSYDIAGVVGLDYRPQDDLADRVLRRLFPWAPTGLDPWDSLLWANGRISLGDRPRLRRWRWHCAPLDQWDGQPPADMR